MGGGMKPAAFGAAAVVDRPAAEDFGEPLQRAVIPGIDKPVTARRAGDMAAIERRDRQPGQRIDHLLAQPLLADILVQHPEKMADPGASAVMQVFFGESCIHRRCEFRIADKGRMRIQHVQRAGVADRHQRQAMAFRQRQDAHVEGIESGRIDRAQFARAGAGRRFQLHQLEPEPGRHKVGRIVEFGAGAAGRATRVIGEFHGFPTLLPRSRPAASAASFSPNNRPDRVDLAAREQSPDAPQIAERAQPLNPQDQFAGINPAAARNDVAQGKRMPGHFGRELCRLRLQRLDDPADDRNAGRAYFLAFVTGHAIEDAGQFERSLDFLRIVARIERGLRQLNERGRAGEIGQVAEPDHRTSRVAAHAADAVERLGGVLHLLVRERLGKRRIRLVALQPRLQACDLVFVAGSIDDEIANDRQVAQRLDHHVRLDRFPARQNLAAVHPHRAGAAHFRAAEPSKCQVGRRILRDPVQGIQHPHPFLVRHLKLLVDVACPGTSDRRTLTVSSSPGVRRELRAASVSCCFGLPNPAAIDRR